MIPDKKLDHHLARLGGRLGHLGLRCLGHRKGRGRLFRLHTHRFEQLGLPPFDFDHVDRMEPVAIGREGKRAQHALIPLRGQDSVSDLRAIVAGGPNRRDQEGEGIVDPGRGQVALLVVFLSVGLSPDLKFQGLIS